MAKKWLLNSSVPANTPSGSRGVKRPRPEDKEERATGASSTNGPFSNKNQFFNKTNTSGFAPNASTSTFGQPQTSNAMFSSMQPSNIFQNPSTSTFNAGPSTQTAFGSNLFGQQQQPQSTNLFGGTNTFGQQNKATFGFGSTTTQPGIFGQQPQQQSSTSIFQSTTPNIFGNANTFGAQTQVGTVVKFAEVTGTDTMQKNGVAQTISTKHHCITCMKEYENKSLEELRYEDYSFNRKGPQPQTGFTAAPLFGTAASTSGQSLFPSVNDSSFAPAPPSFGQSTAFGQPSTGFGLSGSSVFVKTPGFGTTTSNPNTFGFNSTVSTANPFNTNQQAKPFSQPLFGPNTSQSQQPSAFGTNVFGQNTTQNANTNLFQKSAQPGAGFNTGQSGFIFPQPSTTQTPLFPVSKPNTGFNIFGPTNANSTAFGQTTQSTLGSFGTKPATTSFGQATQPTAFGANLGGLQQSSIFGNNPSKPQSLFGNANTGSLFNSNVFQQPTNTFQLQYSQPQPQQTQPQFPVESSDELKNISLIATDSFPEGPHTYGLDPIFSKSTLDNSTTNPNELKLLLDYSRKKEELIHAKSKLKVNIPKPKRDPTVNKQLFDPGMRPRNSYKCLVIKKFNEPTPQSTVFSKYKNELLEAAEEAIYGRKPVEDQTTATYETGTDDVDTASQRARAYTLLGEFSDTSLVTSKPSSSDIINITKVNPVSNSTKFPLTALEEVNLEIPGTAEEADEDDGATSSLDGINNEPNPESTENQQAGTTVLPAGVRLTRPEYYMRPSLEDLDEYIDENGDCIVQGLVVGRKGYGNVYFPDPVNITNMNLDDIVHFRHREVIIYPDESKRPPVGEGLNRRAQVTLDKIYPREKGTNNYVTDVEKILGSNFTDNLMNVTQKHNCKFVEYRPNTGSWVFKVKHFSIYSFTDSDEEECEITLELLDLKKKEAAAAMAAAAAIAAATAKKSEGQEIGEPLSHQQIGLGGGQMLFDKADTTCTIGGQMLFDNADTNYTILQPDMRFQDKSLEYWQPKVNLTINLEAELERKAHIQFLKASLFHDESEKNVAKQKKVKEKVVFQHEPDVIVAPELCTSIMQYRPVFPKKPYQKNILGCYTDLGLFKGNAYKVGWLRGVNLYQFDEQYMHVFKKSYNLNQLHLEHQTPEFVSMMPNLEDCLNIVLEESQVTIDKMLTPTYKISQNLSFLAKQQALFADHVKSKRLGGSQEYFSAVWHLCTALWGGPDQSLFERRDNVSAWLKRFSYSLAFKKAEMFKKPTSQEEALEIIFELLTYNQTEEAAALAMKFKMVNTAIMITQLSHNELCKNVLRSYVQLYPWQAKSVPSLYKKIYLLLAGIAFDGDINICNNLDWRRCFGLHLWYLAPSALSVQMIVEIYKIAFEEIFYVGPPHPSYNNAFTSSKYDMLYHILQVYSSCKYRLSDVLDPETHTENKLDYRFSWILLQLFLSLNVGYIAPNEENYLHTTFANQLEDLGMWQWSIFVLLFLKNNSLKKNLIMRTLERNISPYVNTTEIERDLVKKFKMPASWIHEVKAYQAETILNAPYETFQHYLYMNSPQKANSILVKKILPELFIYEHYEYLEKFIKKLQPYENILFKWDKNTGIFGEFLEIQDLPVETIEGEMAFKFKVDSICRRLNCFPRTTDEQKLCVAELSKKCALLFRSIFEAEDPSDFPHKMADIWKHLVMPPDFMHVEILYLISKLPMNLF